MTVNSLSFMVFFLVVALCFYLLPQKFQWICLLVASLAFYALAGATTFVWIFITCVTTYLAVRQMERMDDALKASLKSGEPLSKDEQKQAKAAEKAKKRKVLVLLLVINIGILVMLKYCNFLINNVNLILGAVGIPALNQLGLVAPLGISYYTLTSMGYAIDVYKGKYKPERNFFKNMLFISFFPIMTQGPFSRFNDLAPQLFAQHSFCYHNLSFGCQRILWGFFKKFVIADRLQPAMNTIFSNYNDYSGMSIFLGCIYMSVQIYADSSAYLDIVAGFSQILDIRLTENFQRPFFSQSLAEYWRRWHISLSAWFRDYVFYPLSISKQAIKFGKFGKKHFGIRVGKLFPAIYGMCIVWFFTGLWHDASWRYILWGVSNGVVMIAAMLLEPTFNKWKDALHIKSDSNYWRRFSIVRTFLLVAVLKVFPASASTSASLHATWKMITDFRPVFTFDAWFPSLTPTDVVFLAYGLIFFLIVSNIQEKHPVRPWLAEKPLVVRWLVYFLLLGSILTMGVFNISMVGGFAYAQF